MSVPYTEEKPIERREIWWNELDYHIWLVGNVGERGTYADGDIDEVVDTRKMRQVEDTDQWPGSGSPMRRELKSKNSSLYDRLRPMNNRLII